MPNSPRRRGPTQQQLDAAIEGAGDPINFNTGHGGDPAAAAASAQGASDSTAGPLDAPTGPAQETGGPRGSGYPPSRTSGGCLDPEGDPGGVEPDEAIKRETAIFEPGTMRKR